MIELLSQDILGYPNAFRLNGPLDELVIAEWTRGCDFPLPPELVEIWRRFGGGEAFETEMILEPRAGSLENIDIENKRLQGRGCPPRVLVFHSGALISGIAPSSGIATFDSQSFRMLRRFQDIDDWYRNELRAEFGARYGFDKV